jgi:hypothetical protein
MKPPTSSMYALQSISVYLSTEAADRHLGTLDVDGLGGQGASAACAVVVGRGVEGPPKPDDAAAQDCFDRY